MRVLVTGGSGQLGREVCRALEARGADYIAPSSAALELTRPGDVYAALAEYRPEAVLHCAAYTGVDQAQRDAARCLAVNRDGAAALARACERTGAKLLYVSTEYVFSGAGERPWETDDAPGPLNVYGESKLLGEQAVERALSRYFIVRTSWLFGKSGNNFIKTMLRLAQTQPALRVVGDQIGSPTYARDLAALLCGMVATDAYGLYHAAGEGFCSRAALARETLALAGAERRVEEIATRDYPTPAARPLNSRLSKRSLDAGGFPRLPDWRDALGRYLEQEEGF